MLRTITRIALPFAVALAATPLAAAPLAAPAAKEVELDGFHFTYTVELEAGELIVLAGRDLDRDEEFELTVKPSGKVVGWVGNRAVEFSVERKQRNAIFARLTKQQPAEVAEAAPVSGFPAAR